MGDLVMLGPVRRTDAWRMAVQNLSVGSSFNGRIIRTPGQHGITAVDRAGNRMLKVIVDDADLLGWDPEIEWARGVR